MLADLSLLKSICILYSIGTRSTMPERKYWACFLCKNRKNLLERKRCTTCSGWRQQDRFVINENGIFYVCKAITGIPIPQLSIYCTNNNVHMKLHLPMTNDSIKENVLEGLKIAQQNNNDNSYDNNDDDNNSLTIEEDLLLGNMNKTVIHCIKSTIMYSVQHTITGERYSG